MNINNYYSVSYANDQLIINNQASKSQRSNFSAILSTLNQLDLDHYSSVSSEFEATWGDIKKRIEYKKSGFIGWIVNIFYYLSGRNANINKIDLKVKTFKENIGLAKSSFADRFKFVKIFISEDKNQATTAINNGAKLKIWIDKTKLQTFHLLYKASDDTLFRYSYQLSGKKQWRATSYVVGDESHVTDSDYNPDRKFTINDFIDEGIDIAEFRIRKK